MMQAHAQVTPPASRADVDRFKRFGEELDELKRRTLEAMGEEDLAYVKRLDRFSRAMEIFGRALIFVSPDPFTFALGVGALFVHKQVQATEIGHTALHGVYDRLEPDGKYASKNFKWDAPVDEESWKYAHNVRHHGSTNIAGKDGDIHFGRVRLTEQTPPLMKNGRLDLILSLSVIFPNFLFVIGSHVCGLNDVFDDNGLPGKTDFIPDRSKQHVREAWKKGLRKYVPHYLKEYGLYPLLAGPLFGKVMLGNYLAGTIRDIYSAATIFCGHVGEEVKSWPAGTKARNRGEWYAMQVEASNNYEVAFPFNIMCGGLERQIEHHLFPTLPPQRLREIAPEVRAICERHGVQYRTGPWGQVLKKVFKHLDTLARDQGARAALSHAM